MPKKCDFTLNLLNRFKKKEFELVLVKMNRPEDFLNGLDVWSEPLRWVGDANLINAQKPMPLVLSPHPCVYRASAIQTLKKADLPWRLVFSSPSYAGTVAAVKAGLGITVMPYTMIPHDLLAIDVTLLPKLVDAYVSLLKHQANNAAVNSLELFVLQKIN